MRFNPPPGWPSPPDGWAPPEGWTPDPAWPLPPPGWRLWIDGDEKAEPDTPRSHELPVPDQATIPEAEPSPVEIDPSRHRRDDASPEAVTRAGSPHRRGGAVVVIVVLVAMVAAVFYLHRSGSAEDSGPARQDGPFMVASIALSHPAELAVDPQNGTVYATQVGGKTLWAIDETTRNPRTIGIELDVMPTGMTVDPVAHTLYVTATSYGKGGNGSPEGILMMIDPAAQAVTATVKVGKNAAALVVDSAGQFAYVGTHDGLAVVDLRARRVATVIAAASDVGSGMAIDPGTDTVFAVVAGAVLAVDSRTRTVSARIPVESEAASIAVDSSTHTVYATEDQAGAVAAVDGSQQAKIPVGSGPGGVAVDPSTHTVFVANFEDGTVSVVNGATESAISTITVGERPYRAAVDARSHTAYVSTAAGIKAITPA